MIKKYRRLSDGLVIEAVQYGKEGRYEDGAIREVAGLLLGIDVDAQVSVANERMFDVITPIQGKWSPQKGIADVVVTDPYTGMRFTLSLGDWVVRNGDQIAFVQPGAFREEYEEVLPEVPRTEFDDLSDVIYSSFSNLEGDLYQALAEKAASAVIRAGWSRRREG